MTLKTIRYTIEFIPILVADAFFRLLPRRLAIGCGAFLGRLGALLLPSRRRLVRKNLKMAFPETSEAQRESTARQVWTNLGRVVAEFVRLSDLTKDQYRDFVDVENEELMTSALSENKGVILVGFHFANWEITGAVTHHIAPQTLAIARPIKNPLVQKWVEKKRGEGSMNIILHRNAVRGSLRALQEKKVVGILVDQNLYTGGVFVDFFGVKAATTTLPALLHLRTGAPVLIAYVLRNGDRFTYVLEKPNLEALSGPEGPSPAALTQSINRHIERIIRAQPASWFWVHNRWKRQPPSDVSPSN